MEMVKCKASLRGQCPHDWLQTHAKTIEEIFFLEKFVKLEVEALDQWLYNNLFAIIKHNDKTKL